MLSPNDYPINSKLIDIHISPKVEFSQLMGSLSQRSASRDSSVRLIEMAAATITFIISHHNFTS